MPVRHWLVQCCVRPACHSSYCRQGISAAGVGGACQLQRPAAAASQRNNLKGSLTRAQAMRNHKATGEQRGEAQVANLDLPAVAVDVDLVAAQVHVHHLHAQVGLRLNRRSPPDWVDHSTVMGTIVTSAASAVCTASSRSRCWVPLVGLLADTVRTQGSVHPVQSEITWPEL